MPIRFPCPHCKQKLSVSSRKAGVRVACPNCKQPLRIPQPPQSAEVGEAGKPSAGASVRVPSSAAKSKTAAAPQEPPASPPAAAEKLPAERATEQVVATPPSTGPAYEEPAVEQFASEEAVDDDPNIFAQFAFDDDTEWVYDTSEPVDEATQSATIDYDRVSVPRLMIYAQGALLGIVGLFCFSIGLLAGSAFFSSAPTGPVAAQPCVVSGKISYMAGNRFLADEGAVVVVLPQTERLEERSAIVGLRPSDPPPEEMQRSVEIIRTIGGAYTRADEQGRYQLRLPDRGNYYVLVLSNHAKQASLDEIKTPDLLKMGRYFDVPADLLGKQKYQWTEANIRADRKLNVDF